MGEAEKGVGDALEEPNRLGLLQTPVCTTVPIARASTCDTCYASIS